jgi:hypothetical protein
METTTGIIVTRAYQRMFKSQCKTILFAVI